MIETKRVYSRNRMKRILLALWDFNNNGILKARKIRLHVNLNRGIRKLNQTKNVQLKSYDNKLIVKKPAFLESKSIKTNKKLTLTNIHTKYLVSLMRFLDKSKKIRNYTVPTDDKNLKIFKNLEFLTPFKSTKTDKNVKSKFKKSKIKKGIKKANTKKLKNNPKKYKNSLQYEKFKETRAKLKENRKNRKIKTWKIWAAIKYYKRLNALRKKNNFFKNRSGISLAPRNKFSYRLNIVVKANNVFCTFSYLNNVKRRTLKVCNGGSYKLNFSKKNIRFIYNNDIITPFIEKVKMYCFTKKFKEKALYKKQRKISKKIKPFWYIKKKNSGVVVNIVASSRQRKIILNNISYHFRRVPLLIKIHDKKIFNGCRAPKKQRKKRRRMRILK